MSVRRLARILRIAARHLAALAAEAAADRWAPLGRLRPDPPVTRPERLRTAFEQLGGTFVKFGQMLALQPDILPLDYCNALFKLLDRIEPFPYHQAERIFAGELGRTPDEVFDSIDRTPLATASVGQVYTARLDGHDLAVKIQRPNVELEFASDIRLMAAVTRLIRALRIRPAYWLIEPTTEFIAWSREELDYRYEARYSEELRRHAAANPVQVVPRVYGELTTRRVLVVEFLDGTTLLDLLRADDAGGDGALAARLAARGFERERFAAHLIANFMGDAFRHGIYHADLHPANLMILPTNVVGYIDFGITGLMSAYSRRHLVVMTLALVRGDLETMAAEYLAITVHDAGSDIAGFRAGLARLTAGWYERRGGRLRLRERITLIFGQMLELSRHTRVMPERDIVKYIRSAIAIDGLLTRFAPAFDIGAHLESACAELLAWEARRGLVDPERMLDWATAGGRLLADGPRHAARAVERLEAGGRPAPAAAAGNRRRGRALLLGAAVLGAAVLFAGPAGPAAGQPLWTAELVFLAAAGSLLAANLVRLRG